MTFTVRCIIDEASGVQASARKGTITGRLVPFGEVGHPGVGPDAIEFAAGGNHDWTAAEWLNVDHDQTKVIARRVEAWEADDGLYGTWKVLDTHAGQDALIEAAAGARPALSVEAEILTWDDIDGRTVITGSRITEAALVRRGAFPSALTTDVAATAATSTTDDPEEDPMEETAPVVETTDTIEAVQAAAPVETFTPRIHVAAAGLPTVGEYLCATLSQDPAVKASMLRRVKAAAPHTFVADIPGLIPKEIVGPVTHLRDGSAPIYSALGPHQAPSGASFRVPVVSPELEYAKVATEKTDVTKQFGVTDVTVTMEFIKRAVNLSAEAIMWSQPGVLDVAVDELAEALAIGSEAAITAKIEAASGTNTAVQIALNGSDVWSKMSGAVAAHYAACGAYPSHFLAAPDVWAKIAGFVNASGQPLVGTLNQTLNNGPTGSLFGIPAVVSPNLTAGKAFLVSERGVKTWTNGTVEMRVNEPTILGVALGAGRGVGVSIASGKFITPVSVAVATQAAK